MDTFRVGKINGAVVLDKRRPKFENKTCYYPVKARVTFEQDRYYIALGFDMTEEVFNDIFGIVEIKGKKPIRIQKTLRGEKAATYKLITAQFERIKNQVEEIHKTEDYSHEKLRNKLAKGKKSYLDSAFEFKIDQLNRKGQAGTASSYEVAKKFIDKYQTGLRFVDITPQWLDNFEYWALNNSIKDKKTGKLKGITQTSLGFYLRNLRALYNDAIKSGEVPSGFYPFQSKGKNGYNIDGGEGTKIALTVDQMGQIKTMQLDGAKEKYRDIFLLTFYLGGINLKDLLLLKWKNIKNGEVHFIREKTKNTVHNKKSIKATLTDPARAILDRWGNPDRTPDAYVIQQLSDGLTPQRQRDLVKYYTKQMNVQLKAIGKLLKIEGLSSMVARHSFATILKNSGAPVAFISETLGHTSSKTTESYLKSFESEQRKKHFETAANIG